MAFTLEDFDKIWASTSPLTPYEFSESNYQQGWNFIGATPPARQMWDFLQKRNDEKTQWLYNNKLSLSGGTMTGTIVSSVGSILTRSVNNSFLQINGGTAQANGSWLRLNGAESSNSGFALHAVNTNDDVSLNGTPNGSLTWGSKNVSCIHAYDVSASKGYIRYTNGLQIVWGSVDSVGTTAMTENYEVDFSAYPSVTATASSNATIYIPSNNNTRFTVRTESGTTTVRYIAIGKWK